MQRGISLYSIVCVCCFFIALPFVLRAQSLPVKIDRYVQAYADQQLFSGSVLVARQGKVLLNKGYGLANQEWGISNTPQTRFRIASLTKQFTAVLIMQLKEQGKLALQAPIATYLPYYRKDLGGQITVHHLLTHTAGIPDYTERPDFFASVSKGSYATQMFVSNYCSDSLLYTPGSQYRYSNAGYYLLGAIIEVLTGKPYAQVLQERIFNVAGMPNSGLDVPATLVSNRAAGYDCLYGKYSNADYINNASTVYAAGGIYSTVGDLLAWDKALYGGKLLSKNSLDTLLTPFLSKYAYGLTVNTLVVPGMDRAVTFAIHTGGINGFRSVMYHEIQDDEVIIILGNSALGNFENDLSPIANNIYSILHQLPSVLPKRPITWGMASMLPKGGVQQAIALFLQEQQKKNSIYNFATAESDLNSFGYYLTGLHQLKDAIAVFQLNTTAFPASWNVFDSYAEALAADGQTAAAIENYKRSVALNPDNLNGKAQLERLTAH